MDGKQINERKNIAGSMDGMLVDKEMVDEDIGEEISIWVDC